MPGQHHTTIFIAWKLKALLISTRHPLFFENSKSICQRRKSQSVAFAWTIKWIAYSRIVAIKLLATAAQGSWSLGSGLETKTLELGRESAMTALFVGEGVQLRSWSGSFFC